MREACIKFSGQFLSIERRTDSNKPALWCALTPFAQFHDLDAPPHRLQGESLLRELSRQTRFPCSGRSMQEVPCGPSRVTPRSRKADRTRNSRCQTSHLQSHVHDGAHGCGRHPLRARETACAGSKRPTASNISSGTSHRVVSMIRIRCM